jgi:hypothetical protein
MARKARKDQGKKSLKSKEKNIPVAQIVFTVIALMVIASWILSMIVSF